MSFADIRCSSMSHSPVGNRRKPQRKLTSASRSLAPRAVTCLLPISFFKDNQNRRRIIFRVQSHFLRVSLTALDDMNYPADDSGAFRMLFRNLNQDGSAFPLWASSEIPALDVIIVRSNHVSHHYALLTFCLVVVVRMPAKCGCVGIHQAFYKLMSGAFDIIDHCRAGASSDAVVVRISAGCVVSSPRRSKICDEMLDLTPSTR